MPPRRRSSSRNLVAALVSVAVVLVLTAVLLSRLTGPVSPPPPPSYADECIALGSDRQPWSFDPEQVSHAATIGAVALRRGLPTKAVTVALATALQESRLRNVRYGDRDSLGLFQQRPSQGWGTAPQVQDPVYASGRFYDHLVKVSRWQQRPVTIVAQAVQRSAFPDAYAQWEAPAEALARALTGASTASLGCHLHPAASSAGASARPTRSAAPAPPSPAATRLRRDLASDLRVQATVDPADPTGRTLVIPATGMHRPWAVASWCVARAAEHATTMVSWAGRRWTRSDAAWSTVAAAPTPPTAEALRISVG